MNKAIIIAEHNGQILHSQLAQCITCAKQFGNDVEVHIALFGYQCEGLVKQALENFPVSKIIIFDDQQLEYPTAEIISTLILPMLGEYQYVLALADTFGKNILPRLAAKLNTCQISEVIEVVTPNTFKRLSYAGNIIETVKSSASCKVMTIRPIGFSKCQPPADVTAATEYIPLGDINIRTSSHLSFDVNQNNRPKLTDAKIVIGGGRGLGSRDNFQILFRLADCLNAAIGATRAAVDAEYISNDYQIGQTGKIIAPELYIAVGISGAIQHLAGIKDSRIIVAINQDPKAPIIEVADYYLIGDLFEIIPELEQALVKCGENEC